MSLEIIQLVLSLKYRNCANISAYVHTYIHNTYMYFDSSSLPPKTKNLNNHTTVPHATTVGKRVLWVFFVGGGLFEERKKFTCQGLNNFQSFLSGMKFELMCMCVFMGRTGCMCAKSSKLYPNHSQLQTPQAEESRGQEAVTSSDATCHKHTIQHLRPLLPAHSLLLSIVLLSSSFGVFSCCPRVT